MASVSISNEGREAALVLAAGEHLSVEALRQLLSSANIHAGLDRNALSAATVAHAVDRVLVIARALPPKAGIDGRVEPLLHLGEHGRRRVFADVALGQVLANLVDPHPGAPGQDVHGQPIHPAPGAAIDAEPWCGDGVVALGGTLRAAQAGICRLAGSGHGRFSVLPTLELDEVDIGVGAIDTGFPVHVRGDIRAGCPVKTRATLTVHGAIEDARVSAQGDIDAGGILAGHERVKTHRDLKCRHIDAREVKCRRLEVANDIHEANIQACGHVVARSVMGGRLLIAGSLTCRELGDAWGVPTTIMVGVNPYEQALHEAAVREHARAEAALLALDERLRLLSAHLRDGGDRHALVQELTQVMHEREARQQVLAHCDDVLAHHASRVAGSVALMQQAVISVDGTLHPGVHIRFGDVAGLEIKEPVRRVVLRLIDGTVSMGTH